MAALDVWGNVAPSYTGTVTLRSSNANALLSPSTYAYTGPDAGTHTFAGGATIYLSGSQNVTVTDTGGRAAALPVSISSASAVKLALAAPATSVAGAAINLTVTALDLYGNFATGIVDIMTFGSTDGNASLPAAYRMTGADGGTHTFNANTVLRTSGARTITVSDSNNGSVTAAQATVTVSPNVVTGFSVAMPASVQPTLPFSATISSRDAYGNLVPTYTGILNLLSSDAIGTPSTSTPLALTYTGSNSGAQTVNNLRLRTLGAQTLSASDSVQTALQGNATTNVQQQPFSTTFYFTDAAAGNYTYNANNINISQSVAWLKPIYTSVGDNAGSAFAGGTSVNTVYDANGLVRLNTSVTAQPWLFYSSLGYYDPQLTWTNTVDAANGNISNVGGLCCGISGPETNPNAFLVYQSNAATSALLYSGNALGGNTTFAYTKAWSLQGNNLILDANSVLSYWVWPQASGGANGNANTVTANSPYVALNVVLTDGTDTRTAALVDGNSIAFNPNSQGAGGRIIAGQWNFVRVSLATLAGKQVDRIDVGWQRNGALGGYRGFIDQVFLSGNTNRLLQSPASLDASWTPAWNNLVAYWPFEGTGAITHNQNILGTLGPLFKASNVNGSGLSYVNGAVGQAVFVDGEDDGLAASQFTVAAQQNLTVMMWTKNLGRVGCNCSFSIGGCGSPASMWINKACGNETAQYFGLGGNLTTQYLPNQVPSGQWSHLALVVSGSVLSSYRDGQFVGSSNNGNAPLAGMSGLYLSGSINTTSTGMYDEVAVWNTALTGDQIFSIFQRQASVVSGSFTASPMAMPFAASTNNGLSWNTNVPASKPIANGSASESNAVCRGIGSASLNSNLVLLWHLDEPVLGTYASGDFNDNSGSGNTGAAYSFGGVVLPNMPGVFGRSVGGYRTSLGYILSINQQAGPQVFTMALWFQYTGPDANGSGLMQFQGSPSDRTLYVGADGRLRFQVAPNNTNYYVTSGALVNDHRWHHAVGTLSSAGQKLYLDGVLVDSNTLITSGAITSGVWALGKIIFLGSMVSQPVNFLWPGQIDEVGVWNRALSASEIQQLYRRGANRLLLQVRQCSASNCSDDAAGANWKGPDATAATYFSEVSPGGLTPGLSPLTVYTTAAPTLSPNLALPYVQYRSFMHSDDAASACSYAGRAAPCSPEMSAVSLFHVNYPTGAPAITLAANASPYYTLTSFVSALGSAGCTGGVTYNLSPDGVNSYYYNGSSWQSANGTALQSTPASQLTAAAMSAYTTLTGPQNQTFFSAFLASDGNQPCALQSVGFAGTQ